MLGILFAIIAILTSPVAAAAEDGRPGVVRWPALRFDDSMTKCYRPGNVYGSFADLQDHEVPCDERYKDAENIAGFEWGLNTKLKMEDSPGNRADLEAWKATAGIMLFKTRFDAYYAEGNKQTGQHAYLSRDVAMSSVCLWKSDDKDPDSGCRFARTDFQRDYWFALEGDNGAQMNVASCFQNGEPRATAPEAKWPCHRVVMPNETMMCAWYLVAASSGHPKSAKAAEYFGYVYECDKRPWAERQAILGTASQLFERIYHRPLPLAR